MSNSRNEDDRDKTSFQTTFQIGHHKF